MKKKIYKLSDIEKILTNVPPLFIILIIILSMLVTYFVIEHRENSEIKLQTQKHIFTKQNYLNTYKNAVNLKIKSNLIKVNETLKRNVNTLCGIDIGLEHKKGIDVLLPYIKMIEGIDNIHFVVFDKNLNVLYGLETIENIQDLIFNYTDNKKHLDFTLLYIYSQGKQASFSWKNDLTKTIQLSYFEHTRNNNLIIGAFSSVDDLKSITVKSFVSSIQEGMHMPNGYYFWLFDSIEKKAFNVNNNHRWQILHAVDEKSIKSDIDKYFLTIGISQDAQTESYTLGKNIKKIKEEYFLKRGIAFTIIIVVGFLLITFTTLFSNFIKVIFSDFNKSEERKNNQINNMKERYELAVIASNDGLWDTNFKTKKTFFSKKWLDMLGYSRGDIKTYDDWVKIIHPEDREKVLGGIEAHSTYKNDEHFISEYRLKKFDGSYVWILGRGKIVLDEHRKPLRLSMMSMDIDEKKEASRKLNKLVKIEVAKNQKKQKLMIQQNKMAAMGEMIGAIAHQWRQPLNNISLILHFIRDNAKNKIFVDTMMNDYVERAKSQIEYMSHTIDDFRDFYKPSKDKKLFDIKEAIESTLVIMQVQIEKNKIDVEIHGESFSINSYENEFKQAILNILSNAKDAICKNKSNKSISQGKIVITLHNNDIMVYNNGGFANEEVLDRMFEPYYTTKFEDKGTGIGLYMTKTIIEDNMGAKIEAKNIDEGVMFMIKGLK